MSDSIVKGTRDEKTCTERVLTPMNHRRLSISSFIKQVCPLSLCEVRNRAAINTVNRCVLRDIYIFPVKRYARSEQSRASQQKAWRWRDSKGVRGSENIKAGGEKVEFVEPGWDVWRFTLRNFSTHGIWFKDKHHISALSPEWVFGISWILVLPGPGLWKP